MTGTEAVSPMQDSPNGHPLPKDETSIDYSLFLSLSIDYLQIHFKFAARFSKEKSLSIFHKNHFQISYLIKPEAYVTITY